MAAGQENKGYETKIVLIGPATSDRPQAPGKTHPYMAGQPLPAEAFGELGSPDDLNLIWKDMILDELILKEFGLKLKRKIDVFSKVVACADATWTQDVNLWKTS